ncbi:MAG: AAA family ATPase, partial [Clostridia bacterium]|nr:AAA family ATPase [Clostridia bacterium]
MYKEVSKLLLYSNLGPDSILTNLCDIFKSFEEKSEDKDTLVHKIYVEMKRLLDLATQYGFDTNLWHNYLTFLLITNENSFTLTCERQGATDGGSVNAFAKNDFSVFMRLFHFDFAPIEKALGIDCFSVIT